MKEKLAAGLGCAPAKQTPELRVDTRARAFFSFAKMLFFLPFRVGFPPFMPHHVPRVLLRMLFLNSKKSKAENDAPKVSTKVLVPHINLRTATTIATNLVIRYSKVTMRYMGPEYRLLRCEDVSTIKDCMQENYLCGSFLIDDREVPIYVGKRSLAAERYRYEILNPYIGPHADAIGEDFILMGDNARPQRSRLAEEYLEDDILK
ncbi:hypothetical protein AVEN_95304-1 [Araneus ventricosus]|uniref:Uncharacterized protein n=1 Tax=Araneus ventricosus TaxID=182803 RepID=A0A4Y2KNZ1_ARAVE|nr:hypothetical protein AVEN_95304-1 [Araneus ventricosus]